MRSHWASQEPCAPVSSEQAIRQPLIGSLGWWFGFGFGPLQSTKRQSEARKNTQHTSTQTRKHTHRHKADLHIQFKYRDPKGAKQPIFVHSPSRKPQGSYIFVECAETTRGWRCLIPPQQHTHTHTPTSSPGLGPPRRFAGPPPSQRGRNPRESLSPGVVCLF